MMTLNAGGIQLVKVVGSQIGVGFLLPQDRGNDHQQTVGDGDNGLLSPTPFTPALYFLVPMDNKGYELRKIEIQARPRFGRYKMKSKL